jgi:hypothetical protein
MRTFHLLALVCVVLAGSPAGATTVAVSTAPAAPVADVAPAQAPSSPLCLAQIAQAQLPAGNPAVMKSTQLCGACSDVRCTNNTLGAVCRTGGYTCQNIYGNFCAQDGRSVCTCSNWPPF